MTRATRANPGRSSKSWASVTSRCWPTRLHDDGVSWTLVSAKQQRAQDARYTLTPEGDSTRVRFELMVDLTVPVPGFLIKKGTQGLMDTATEGLRKRVLEVKKGGK